MTPEEIASKLTEVEQRGKSNSHRLDDVEKRQNDLDSLVTSVAVMATKQEAIEKDVMEIKTDVKTLTAKPAKRWDNFIDKLFWLLIGAVVSFVLVRLGISG